MPLGLTSNASIFSSRNMLVFLVNHEVEKVTLWWDGRDIATQTKYAWENIYFNDDPDASYSYGVLNNGIVRLRVYNFRIESTVVGRSTTSTAKFMRINEDYEPTYGADPAYVIYNGIVRDIIQQEAEWSGGVPNCPNVYSQIVLTLPANATYYTYALRTIFVDSSGVNPARTLNELSVLELSIYPGESGTGECITEDGINATGFPIPSYLEGLFYNSSSATGWAHHWSEFLKGNKGAGIMFTNNSNFNLYTFDSIAGYKTGALDVDKQTSNTIGHIEVNPVERYQASFINPLDVTWHGAVVTFEDAPIYPSSGGNIGLWVIVEHPPIIAVS